MGCDAKAGKGKELIMTLFQVHLAHEERSKEAIKLLDIIRPNISKLGETERNFVVGKIAFSKLTRNLYVSSKELYWLRDIASKLD